MSEPIQIKQEKNNGYFSAWWAKKQEKEKDKNIEETIFEMDDDELPPKLQSPEKNGFDNVVVSEEEDEEPEQEPEPKQDACFGYPCTNMIYFDKCNRCKDSPICNLIIESVQQGFDDMRNDLHELWKKDVVKVWSAFLTVCYFNIPNEAMLCGVMYLVHKKFEQEEDKITCRSTLPPVTDSETDGAEDEESDTENKKCV